ncbi:type II toxin-antitoxin system VapC family toxin [Tunturiibacter lichenicola]|uniref:type II toxin-antitoxin system VapC family toxin n=1 Tax=Tunturiibacter lichenicola TaxID=2051959 RepID=UPI003D9AFCDB
MSELFDTNILIDHLNGVAKATRELKRSNHPAISMITWTEVMTGAASPAEEAVLRSFLLNFECLPVSGAVAERAAVVRREMKIKMPDAIILATAEVSGRELVTRNVKDFPTGMRDVRVPYKV